MCLQNAHATSFVRGDGMCARKVSSPREFGILTKPTETINVRDELLPKSVSEKAANY